MARKDCREIGFSYINKMRMETYLKHGRCIRDGKVSSVVLLRSQPVREKGILMERIYINESGEEVTKITIPEGVTSIGDWAFEECTKLKEVTIPNSVTHIWDNAFYECISLTEITIPDSVTYIGDRAFDINMEEYDEYE